MSNEPIDTACSHSVLPGAAETTTPLRFALLWLLHQIIAFVGGFAILFALTKSQAAHTAVWIQVTLMFVGEVFLGYATPRTASNIRAALMVWFLPTLVFVGAFLWNWYDFGLARTVSEYFAVDIGDNPRMATAIFTVPAGFAIAYSLGAVAKKWVRLRAH